MRRLIGVRSEDQRTVAMASATLFLIVASHAILETARDSLFLADLPVSRLPWAYLGVALLAFVVARASDRFLAARSPRRVLAIALGFGAIGTAGFWSVVAVPAATSLTALYVWTGLLASVVVTQFWVQLGSRMDVGQAKRGYPVVAAAGLAGATAGSLIAGLALRFEGPRVLVLVAAGTFALAACVPAFSRDEAVPVPPTDEDVRPGFREIGGDPYLRRILGLALIGPVVAMGIDFIFKSVVSHEVPRAALGAFFARYNAVVNAAALVFQVTMAPRLLQRIGVVRNLCLLPASLGVVAVGVASATALPAALLLRGTDGILRHSLHRAATEILFLPLSGATRRALRALAESIGQRGGQVLGSLAILVAIRFGATPRMLAIGVAGLCAIWLVGYLRLQGHYLERFRSQLRLLSPSDEVAVPELDLKSLETLVATLSAVNDAEVLAALALLASYGRTRLVSPLILYHPSTAVVLRALRLFEGVRRDDVQDIRRRLLEHADPAVRAASLRGLVAGGADSAIIRTTLRGDRSPLVRITALVLWMGSDQAPVRELDDAVADLLALSDADSRLAVADTLGELPNRLLLPVAHGLLADATPAIRRQVARTLATAADESRLDLLIALVELPECRAFARAGLQALGPPALEGAARALADDATPAALRRHLPRTISRFGSARAAAILIEQLGREEDGRVVDKILRGLGRLRADDPHLPVDRPALIRVAERCLQRMVELLAYRVGLELLGAPDDPDLLNALIAEERAHTLERVFRLLQILETDEEFATIHAALSTDAPGARASARELLGHVLDGPFRDALLALTDSQPAVERLRIAAAARPVAVATAALEAWKDRPERSESATIGDPLHAIVAAMCADSSVILASVARFQLAAVQAPVVVPEASRAVS